MYTMARTLSNARSFTERLRSHMDTYGWSRVPPTGREKAQWLSIHTQGSNSLRPRTAYIHIPFCGILCAFCNFNRGCGDAQDAADYARLVQKELEWYNRSVYVQQGGFNSLYLGGGTPSLLPPVQLAELVRAARTTLQLTEDAEITMESTIHDLDDTRLDVMVMAGVNRISFGVQTFDTLHRRRLGRLSDGEMVRNTLIAARRAGIRTVSADILYRLPGQDVGSLIEDLRIAVEMKLDGVSIYPLIIMDGTPLQKMIQDNKIEPLPTLTEELEQYKCAREYLLAAGYRQSTSTHFALPADHNRYNEVRLNDGDCLAIGCGAGGFLDSLVSMNAAYLPMYQAVIGKGQPGLMAVVELDAKSRMLRTLCGQVQRGFLEIGALGLKDGEIALDFLRKRIRFYQQRSFLTQVEQRYQLTPEGYAWCYNIAADLATFG